MKVRRSDEGRGQRRRWAFFSNLLRFQVDILPWEGISSLKEESVMVHFQRHSNDPDNGDGSTILEEMNTTSELVVS